MEIMIAIAIIAILTAIIAANLQGSRAKARDGQRISDVSQLQLTLQLYYDKCGQYPSSLVLTTSNGCPSGVTLNSFISKISTPPSGAGQTSYDYSTLTSNGAIVNYVIRTVLEKDSSILARGLGAMPTGNYSVSLTCTYNATTFNYCVTSN